MIRFQIAYNNKFGIIKKTFDVMESNDPFKQISYHVN